MEVELLDERWTPTSIQTTLAFHSLPRTLEPGNISIDFPLLNLGWTFALLLKPTGYSMKYYPEYEQARSWIDWIPQRFSFRQDTSSQNKIDWGNTSIHAQISLVQAVEQPQRYTESPDAFPQCAEHRAQGTASANDCPGEGSDMTPLATMKIASVVDTPSLNLPLRKSCIISSMRSNKVQLTVTISDCPFPGGLFGARLGATSEARYQMQLVRQSGERLLSRSLATGKFFDVKFMTPSARSSTGKPLPTYASLSVLEEHVNPSSSQ